MCHCCVLTSRSTSAARGVTLIELLVTISVLAVLLTIALPNLRDFVVGNRLSSNVNGFIGLVNYARSEAIVRNQDVVICPKAATATTCASTTAWNTLDIQVFVDADGNGQFNTGDTLLKTMAAVDPAGTQTGFDQAASATLVFGSAGFARTAQSFKVYAKSSDAAYSTRFGRTLCISRMGRVRVAAYTLTSCPDF